MDLSEIQTLSQKMITDDGERDRAFDAYTSIYHNGWNLPEQVKNLPWIKKVISSDPHDAVNTGVRILSTLDHGLHYQPLAPGEDNEKTANLIENVLKWQLMSANRRRSKSIEADTVRSALLYDATAVLVLDLDYQIKVRQALNADTKREEAARRFSRFAIRTYNPRHVHVRYSDIMPEAVLLVEHRHAAEIIDEWGDIAKAIPTLVELAKNPTDDWVTYFDYWDLHKRAVWLAPGRMDNVPASVNNQSMVLVNAEKNPLPFLPWVALMGGSTIEEFPEHKYMPLLYPIYTTGAWDVQNIVRTLAVSEAIAHTGSPRFQESGQNPQHGEIDWMSPERMAYPAQGNTITALQPPDVSNALTSVDTLMSMQISKATVSTILQGGNLPAGMAFATLNLATQTAVGVLKPAKDLSEKTIAEVYTLMLLWTEFTKVPLNAYGTKKKENLGTELSIDPAEIDPSAIYIQVELHPDAPTDRQQRVNTAATAVNQLMYPIEKALEEIGETDPQAAMKTRMKEMFLQHYIDMKFQKDLLELQAEVQMQMQQMQAAAQAAMQSGGGLPGQAAGPGAQGPGGMMTPPGGPAGVPGGQAVNPAQGGEPPSIINPQSTKEMMTGQDFLGNNVNQ